MRLPSIRRSKKTDQSESHTVSPGLSVIPVLSKTLIVREQGLTHSMMPSKPKLGGYGSWRQSLLPACYLILQISSESFCIINKQTSSSFPQKYIPFFFLWTHHFPPTCMQRGPNANCCPPFHLKCPPLQPTCDSHSQGGWGDCGERMQLWLQIKQAGETGRTTQLDAEAICCGPNPVFYFPSLPVISVKLVN